MILIWGTRRSIKSYGFAADWCPQCECVGTVNLASVGTRGHVYYIPLPVRRDLTGSMAVCAKCGHGWNVDLASYAARLKTPTGDTDELVRTTNPGLVADVARRLTLPERLESNTLTTADRADLMKQRALIVGAGLAVRLGQTHVDRWSGACLGLMVAMLITGVACAGNKTSDLSQALLIGAGALFVVFVYLLATDCGRFYRREVRPRLVEYAKQIGLRHEEWPAVHASLRRMNAPIGRVVSRRDMDGLLTGRV